MILVTNPRSSQAVAVSQEVLEPARRLKGWVVGRFEVKPTDVDDNAQKLATILRDGDLVVVAGGDGTATIALNGVALSKKDVTLGVLGYGNFNDMARLTNVKRLTDRGGGGVQEIINLYTEGRTTDIYPLEALIDGVHWRYAACYITVGLFAESTAVFDETGVRWKLRTRSLRLCFSIWSLLKWYFKNRRKDFIPDGYVNRELISHKMTDYMAINGKTVAQLMRGGNWFLDKTEFRSGTYKLGGFWSMVLFMLHSMFRGISGTGSREDELVFLQPSEVTIQAEGEHERLKGVSKIEIRKANRPIKIVRR